jgi:uncharacterized membrane protein
MDQRALAASALASLLALGLLPAASAHDAPAEVGGKEKCFGIVKAGQNECASLSGSHACAGMASADLSLEEWKYVPKGSCAKQGGLTQEQARKKLAEAAAKPAPKPGAKPAAKGPAASQPVAKPAPPHSHSHSGSGEHTHSH